MIVLLLCLLPALHARDPGYIGSAPCAKCHRAIYETYQKTPMARTTGATGSGQNTETFTQANFTNNGFRYEIKPTPKGLRVTFTKSDDSLLATKSLPLFVGSGAAARSYLIADDGYLFEAPVAWYRSEDRWNLAPRYDAYAYPYLTRPVMSGCLNCHASFLAPIAGTQNRFADPPFEEPGIACERCHGPGAAHAEGRGPVLNPAKLDPERRDSICAQCHLSGEVRVRASGTAWDAYRPGARLSDSVKIFVRADSKAGMTVTSHVEKLAQSACKKASGERLWCGSCHDPHTTRTSAQSCLACHQTTACRESITVRQTKRDDCIACHMPKTPVTDAQHVVYTDHSIPRRPRPPVTTTAPRGELVAFAGAASSNRELALAYAIVGDKARALPRLQKAAADAPDDTEVLMYLAEIYRNDGRSGQAIPLYQRAIQLDPDQVAASVGLGSILMEQSSYAAAIPLWEDALARNAGLVLVRTNLAMAYWRNGDTRNAERHLLRTLELSPAFEPAAKLLQTLRAGHR